MKMGEKKIVGKKADVLAGLTYIQVCSSVTVSRWMPIHRSGLNRCRVKRLGVHGLVR